MMIGTHHHISFGLVEALDFVAWGKLVFVEPQKVVHLGVSVCGSMFKGRNSCIEIYIALVLLCKLQLHVSKFSHNRRFHVCCQMVLICFGGRNIDICDVCQLR
jgi:hypothetical protein